MLTGSSMVGTFVFLAFLVGIEHPARARDMDLLQGRWALIVFQSGDKVLKLDGSEIQMVIKGNQIEDTVLIIGGATISIRSAATCPKVMGFASFEGLGSSFRNYWSSPYEVTRDHFLIGDKNAREYMLFKRVPK